MKIYLTSMDHDLSEAWKEECGDLDFVVLHNGSILNLRVDAVVSPANSFGFMDGGIDGVYTQHFGPHVQRELQDKIILYHNGELLVGQAETVVTADEHIPHVIAAPTMRVPMILGDKSVNPYLAAKAVLREALDNGFNSIAFPGLGTGVGQVPAINCAHQVRLAIDEILVNSVPSRFPPTWQQAQYDHQMMAFDGFRDLQYPEVK